VLFFASVSISVSEAILFASFPSPRLGSCQLIDGHTLDRRFLAPTKLLLGHALKELLHSELKARNFQSKVLLFYLQKEMREMA
jgi:hypothetical protein